MYIHYIFRCYLISYLHTVICQLLNLKFIFLNFNRISQQNKQEPIIEQPKIEIKNDEQSDDDSDQFSTIKRSPRDVDKKSVTSPTIQQQEVFRNEVNKQEHLQTTKVEHFETKEVVQQISEQQIVDEIIYGDFSTPGLQARALYDYQAGKFNFANVKLV